MTDYTTRDLVRDLDVEELAAIGGAGRDQEDEGGSTGPITTIVVRGSRAAGRVVGGTLGSWGGGAVGAAAGAAGGPVGIGFGAAAGRTAGGIAGQHLGSRAGGRAGRAIANATNTRGGDNILDAYSRGARGAIGYAYGYRRY